VTVLFNKLILDFSHLKNFYFSFTNFIFNILTKIFLLDGSKDYKFFLDNYNNTKFSDMLYKNIFKKNIFIDII